MGQYYLYTMKNAVLLPVTVKNITRNSLFKKGSDLFFNRVLLHSCSKQECEVAVPGTFLKICLACLDLKSLLFIGICTGTLSGNSCQENLILVVQRSRCCVPLVYQDILAANNLFFFCLIKNVHYTLITTQRVQQSLSRINPLCLYLGSFLLFFFPPSLYRKENFLVCIVQPVWKRKTFTLL